MFPLLKDKLEALKCRAVTQSGQLRFLRKYQSHHWFKSPPNLSELFFRRWATGRIIGNKRNLFMRLKLYTLYDDGLNAKAGYLINVRGRKRTQVRVSAMPSNCIVESTTSLGNYGGYPSYRYDASYHSVLAVTRSGNMAYYLSMGKLIKSIRAPSGLRWGGDALGAFLISKDGTEYHINLKDISSKNFVQRVRAELGKTRKARKIRLTETRNLQNVRVTFQDARAVGACVEGIVGWCQSVVGMDRRETLSPYAFIPGSICVNSNNELAIRAAQRAYMRETMVSI